MADVPAQPGPPHERYATLWGFLTRWGGRAVPLTGAERRASERQLTLLLIPDMAAHSSTRSNRTARRLSKEEVLAEAATRMPAWFLHRLNRDVWGAPDQPSSTELVREQSKLIQPSRDTGELGLVDGRYRVRRLLGAGGMGVVFDAVGIPDPQKIGRQGRVAIKTIRASIHSPEAEARFIGEAEILIQLNHPNIVRTFDARRDDQNIPYIVMEHIFGPTLSDFVTHQAGCPFPPHLVVDIVRQVALGLEAVHGLGDRAAHRDLKPENIFLRHVPESTPYPTCWQVSVGDFGLAVPADGQRLSAAGQRLGTPGYWSPEQYDPPANGMIGNKTDIFSLGVIAYQLLAGRHPFSVGSQSPPVYSSPLKLPVPVDRADPDSGVPGFLGSYIKEMMAKDPGDRPEASDVMRSMSRFYQRTITPPTDRRPGAGRKEATPKPQPPSAGEAGVSPIGGQAHNAGLSKRGSQNKVERNPDQGLQEELVGTGGYLEKVAGQMAAFPWPRPPAAGTFFSGLHIQVRVAPNRDARGADRNGRDGADMLAESREAESRAYQSRADVKSFSHEEGGEPQAWANPDRGKSARAKHPWGVILADPGLGKTTLLRYEGWVTAQEQLTSLRANGMTVNEALIPIYLRLVDLAAEPSPDPIEGILTRFALESSGASRTSFTASFCQYVNRQIEDGKFVALLDAQDEVALNNDQSNLQRRVKQILALAPRRVYFTSRHVGYRGNLLVRGDWHAPELEIVAFGADDIRRFIRAYFGGERDPEGRVLADSVWEALRQNPALLGLAQTPLLVTMLCVAVWERGRANRPALPLPARRSELYAECLTGLLALLR